MFVSQRIIYFFIAMAGFSLVYWLGSLSDVDEDDAQEFLKEFEALIEDIDAIGIFTHNLTIALPMFIPGFGIAWGLFSGWSTGFAFASLATLMPALDDVPSLALLYISPFGMMELVAYSLGISRSYILIFTIIKKLNLGSLIKPTIIEIGIMVGLLLGGAILEDYMIRVATESGIDLGF